MKINGTEINLLLQEIYANTHEGIKFRRHIVITGPSGSGKTSIVRRPDEGIVCVEPSYYSFSVSAATRLMRKNEAQGIDYLFMDPDLFIKTPMLEDNAYLGNGKFYGTTISEVRRITIIEKKRMVLDLDINGGVAVKKIFQRDCFFTFLNTPEEVLLRRLKKRQPETGETDEQIEGRIKAAREERRKVISKEVIPDLILDYDDSMSPGEAANIILLKSSSLM